MKYNKYPSYKDSGVEWLGSVPNHWNIWKLNHFTPIITCGVASTPEYVDEGVKFLSAQNIINNKVDLKKGNKYITQRNHAELTNIRKVKNGDLLMSRVGTIGNTCIVNVDFEFSIFVSLTHLRLNNFVCNSDFFVYLTESRYFRELNSSETLVGGGVGNLNVNDLREYRLPIPPFQEQQTIVNYLDTATAKIDTLIEKQTKLIALLKEKRQAIIFTAVTRGLDNTVAMKDSGVEWLGEIPEHWEVKKLKLIAYAKPSNVDKKSKDGEKDVLLCNYTDVYYNDFITNDIEFMKATATNEQIKKFTLNVDDVIITKDSEGPEDIAIATCVKEVQDNLVCGYHLTHIKPTKCNGRYLFRAFNSDGIHDQFKVAANGITRYGIGVYGIDNSFFPAPPMKEQEEIANYIDDKTSRIDTLISKASKAIELLKERRTALISAVVIGKIDVRKAS